MQPVEQRNPIIIVGGGLGGLALGIALRQKEALVTVFEAGRYPRHRVCGEFISGRGLECLRRLELLDKLANAGARFANSVAFFSANGPGPAYSLPRPALCLSRYALDALLAAEFKRLGGLLRENERWRFAGSPPGLVCATGRRVSVHTDRWRVIGLKAHARNIELAADLEMHVLPNGYVGLCQLEGGLVNVCGLFRGRQAWPDLAERGWEMLCGPSGSPLRARLECATVAKDSFCATAGLPWVEKFNESPDRCCIGDSLGMIPPLTGNGMSMAFESAELAAGPLLSYGSGELDWDAARQRISSCCRQRFSARLAWAGCLHQRMFQFGISCRLVLIALRWSAVRNLIYARTR